MNNGMVMWANGDGTFSTIPESSVPSIMNQNTATTDPAPSKRKETFELVDVLFYGALILLVIATWKEPIGYFALGLLIGWILVGL